MAAGRQRWGRKGARPRAGSRAWRGCGIEVPRVTLSFERVSAVRPHQGNVRLFNAASHVALSSDALLGVVRAWSGMDIAVMRFGCIYYVRPR